MSASPFPLAVPAAKPVPEQFLGFSNWPEALAVQGFLLSARIEDVWRSMTSEFPARLERGEVAYVRPPKPEPPTKGPTVWVLT